MLSSINPDEVLARGAARQAGFITEFCDLHKSIPEPVTDVTFITEPITVQVCNIILCVKIVEAFDKATKGPRC